nr:phage terminase large subunit [Rhizobium sp. CF080]
MRERLSYNALKHRILRERSRWSPGHILIERTGSGVSLLKELNREEGLRRGQLCGMRPRVEKEIRFASAVSRIMDGAFWLPAEVRWLADFRRECLSFPTGKHDDMVDSMTQFMAFLGERRAQARQRGDERPRGRIPSMRRRR